VIVKATGRLNGIRDEGTYAGYFTAEDKFRVGWRGHHTKLQALADSK
jgi:hypothetical protein